MSYQFVHLDAYARVGSSATKGDRKRSANEIICEAERVPGFFEGHVENHLRPIILDGFVAPSVALAEAEYAAESTKDAKGRKLRKDAPIILAGVISCPPELEYRWKALRDDSVKFLKAHWGERLRSVVEHQDEEHSHIHYYVVPRANERALDLHPGFAAKKAAGSRKDTRSKIQNAAYREAMTNFQNEYQNSVGLWHGLSRLGPRLRRMTRSAWKAEKASLASNRAAFDAVKEITEAAQKKRMDAILPVTPPENYLP